jgi:hypothetical protein
MKICLSFEEKRSGLSLEKGEREEAVLQYEYCFFKYQYETGKDEPVKVPPDVQEFLDRQCNDLISHDLAKFMTHYSDRYLNSGTRKGGMERSWGIGICSLISARLTITDFVPAGDRAYLTGFTIFNSTVTMPITQTSIIKESGEWKFYGNQRDVSP